MVTVVTVNTICAEYELVFDPPKTVIEALAAVNQKYPVWTSLIIVMLPISAQS